MVEIIPSSLHHHLDCYLRNYAFPTFLDIEVQNENLLRYLLKHEYIFHGYGIQSKRSSFKQDNKMTIYNRNFENIFFGDYNFVYCNNISFSDNENEKLFEKIKKECKGIVILYKFPVSFTNDFFYKMYQVRTITNTIEWIALFFFFFRV